MRMTGRPYRQTLKLGLTLSLGLSVGVLSALPGWSREAPVSQSLWGYSGLLNIPTAEVLPARSFDAGLRYFPLNSGLSGVANISPLDNLEAGLVFGVPPANGFSALAASLKYRIVDQARDQPLSLAVGATLLGLNEDPGSYVPGNNAFITVSRGFDWDNIRLVNLHGGFMGGLQGARLFAGLDVPILDLARFKTEYLGMVGGSFQAFNFGLSITPHPSFSIDLGLMQRPNQTFWDRDFILGLSWQGDFGQWLGVAPDKVPDKTQPSPSPQPSPTAAPVRAGQGNVRLRMLDRADITALADVQLTLIPQGGSEVYRATTDISGEARFERLPSGNYEVRAERSGWNPEVRLISVQPDLETFLELALSGQLGSIQGNIEVAGGGTPGELSLELLNQTERSVRRESVSGSTYRLEQIAPGPYTLVVRQGGEERLRLQIRVKGNSESQYDLNLPPMPRPEPTPVASVAPTPAPTAVPVAPVSASISGTIKDKQQKLVSGARLELKNDDLLVITLTTPEGKYIFRDIPQGVYRLTLSKEGFKPRVFQLTITKSEALEHNFDLEPEK